MCSSTKVITNKYPPPLRALLVVERNIATQATACRHQRTQRRQHSQRQRRRHTPLDLSLIQQSFCFALPESRPAGKNGGHMTASPDQVFGALSIHSGICATKDDASHP
uniref:Uncharacterized protein n=1 Tax=Ceratitis capitata TaxID=7213 RepID=W8BSD3_CERCA